jgi:AAA+ superfamily predicted ATPase
MTPNDDFLAGLRDALRVSPDNLPLRQTLADFLLGHGQYAEAEVEYRTASEIAPNNQKLKAGLATAFHRQGKNSEAMVIVEHLVKSGGASASVLVLYSRLLLDNGKKAQALVQYRRAVKADPNVADVELAARLGAATGVVRMADTPDPRETTFLTGGLAIAQGEDEPPDLADVERPDVNFSDVGGMESVKDDIRIKIIHPLSHPELYKAYGKATGGGILMYGPPGCGKTHLARATAGEIKASFTAVGITDVMDMWLGSSERNMHTIFEQARRRKPCVLFFDEVDALAASRSSMRADSGRRAINQFLSEMDGFNAKNDGVLMLAATNAPWHVDPAFRRPGRFDSIIFVPPPDAPAREAILRIRLKGKPVDEIDHTQIAAAIAGFSGADLKALVDSAIESKLREAMKTGIPAPLVTKDLAAAAARLKPSTHEWFASARNYAMYSNQGGTYDDVLKYLKI